MFVKSTNYFCPVRGSVSPVRPSVRLSFIVQLIHPNDLQSRMDGRSSTALTHRCVFLGNTQQNQAPSPPSPESSRCIIRNVDGFERFDLPSAGFPGRFSGFAKRAESRCSRFHGGAVAAFYRPPAPRVRSAIACSVCFARPEEFIANGAQGCTRFVSPARESIGTASLQRSPLSG